MSDEATSKGWDGIPLYHFYLCNLNLQRPSFNDNREVNAEVTIGECEDEGTWMLKDSAEWKMA